MSGKAIPVAKDAARIDGMPAGNGLLDRMGRGFHRFANPRRFSRMARKVYPPVLILGLILTAIGVYGGLFVSPADYQQGDSVRIMYVHVPFAWLASSFYFGLAVCGLLSLVWRHPLADIAAREIGPIGAAATAICLATGSIWGKPTWGTWWVWDARLTSVFVLLLLYLGHIALIRAFDTEERGQRAAAILALIGVVNLPVIKFSVDWWNTLHQPASITLTGAPTIATDMLWPLMLTTLGFNLLFAALALMQITAAIAERHHAMALVRSALEETDGWTT